MRTLSLAWLACLGLAASAFSQTATQSSQPPAENTPPPAQSSAQSSGASSEGGSSLQRSCKKEVKKLCGRRARGEEEQDCIKANLDLNKFSEECKSELSAKGTKPST